jgi:hypothetical protein
MLCTTVDEIFKIECCIINHINECVNETYTYDIMNFSLINTFSLFG